MFMHYFGGGVGHLCQGVFMDVNSGMDVDSGLEDGISHQLGQAFRLPQVASNQDQAERDATLLSSDSGSDSQSNTDESECNSDDDLGPDDGENSDVDDNGYASF
jgi:hypothetical protein